MGYHRAVDESIGQLLGRNVDRLLEFTRMSAALLRIIRLCPQPVIAALNRR